MSPRKAGGRSGARRSKKHTAALADGTGPERGKIDPESMDFPGHERLTPQERVVLAQVVRGASSKEAARALGLSHRTVEFHRLNIMRKLGASNIADLLLLVLFR